MRGGRVPRSGPVVSAPRTASFLLAAASLGSLTAATATRSIPAVLASAAVLAVSCVSCRALGLREAREQQRRIAVLGEPFAAVLGMAAGGITRKAFVRGMEPAGGDEEVVAA